jgi:hypothetical protein
LIATSPVTAWATAGAAGLAQSLGTDGLIFVLGKRTQLPTAESVVTWDDWVETYGHTAYVRWGGVGSSECTCRVFRRLLSCRHYLALLWLHVPSERPPDLLAAPGRLIAQGTALVSFQAMAAAPRTRPQKRARAPVGAAAPPAAPAPAAAPTAEGGDDAAGAPEVDDTTGGDGTASAPKKARKPCACGANDNGVLIVHCYSSHSRCLRGKGKA